MKNLELLDSKKWATTDIDEAYRVLDDLSGSVSVVEVKSDKIKAVSYMGENEGKVSFAVCEPPDSTSLKRSRVLGMPSAFTALDKDEFINDWLGGSKAFYKELKKCGFMLNIDGTLYICSGETIGTLCSRCALGGSALTDHISVLRDSYITEILAKKKTKCSVVMRVSEEGIKKVFAVLGGTYTAIPQNKIRDVVEAAENELLEGKESEFCGLTADNFVTRLYFEYPSIADEFRKVYKMTMNVTPGICVVTSDMGDSSLAVYGTIRLPGSKTPFHVGKYSRIHRGNVDIEEFIEGVRDNIFTEYSKIPERIMELLTIDVSDVSETLKAVMEKSGLAKVIGKKYSDQFVEAAAQEFIPGKPYSAFDIANFIAKVPERIIGMADSARVAFARSAKDAFFVNYEEICGTTVLGISA